MRRGSESFGSGPCASRPDFSAVAGLWLTPVSMRRRSIASLRYWNGDDHSRCGDAGVAGGWPYRHAQGFRRAFGTGAGPVFGEVLEVLSETPVAVEPGEGALDHQRRGRRTKPLLSSLRLTIAKRDIESCGCPAWDGVPLTGLTNVATSRANCVSIIVGSEAECRTPRQMQLANAFRRYLEMAKCTSSAEDLRLPWSAAVSAP
jgi:hypothetical protein